MDDADRLFSQGRANPEKFGWPIRSSAGERPDPERIGEAARLLGRPAFLVDADGYECEIIGAATNASGDIAYVESRTKDVGFNQYGANQRHIDVSIRIHLAGKSGPHRSAEIESYNPFFGCDIRFFEWKDRTVVLIYREKHDTYACRFGDIWPPRFVEIEDDWVLNGNILGYVGYKEKVVRRLSFPELDVLDPISAAEAIRISLLPQNRRAT
ncbi:hypothetical protein [Fimbriiglobus ruber]|nr:hypothetical protein [Fimbriiglobus ruber]